MKTIIVAYDRNHGIGFDNDMPWKRDLKADLQRFKEITTGNAIIMGRKTFESLPGVLPNRLNIVITRQQLTIEGVTVVGSLEEAYEAASAYPETFVVGGEQIYWQAIEGVDRILVTEVDAKFQAHQFFPELDMTIWQEAGREHHKADDQNKYNYDFVTYVKQGSFGSGSF